MAAEEDGYDGVLAADGSSDIVVSGDDVYWENVQFAKSITVKYSGASAVVSPSDESIVSYLAGADVTLDLSAAGPVEVIAEGVSDDGQLKFYGSSPVKLTLNGLKLSSGKSSAVNVQSKSVLYVHLPDGTDNYISDSESQSDESYYPDGVLAGDEKRNGALYSKGSVVLSGGGLLQLDGKKKHGVSVKSHLTVRPGVTIVVNNTAVGFDYSTYSMISPYSLSMANIQILSILFFLLSIIFFRGFSEHTRPDKFIFLLKSSMVSRL